MRALRRLHSSESAQVLPLFVLLMFAIVAMAGLATDLGRLYVAHAQLGRSVDAAALAGAKQLPDTAQADAKARAFVAQNEGSATVKVDVHADASARQVEVSATKSVSTLFMRLVGIKTVDVNNSATAGFGIIPLDAVMAIDATGSMGDPPCTSAQNNSGCPIYEAKNAAVKFTNTLLPAANTSIGVTAFRGCYRPSGTDWGCIDRASAGDLDSSAANTIGKINGMSSVGGTGTNVCGGLDRAGEILTGPGASTEPNAVRVIVILSDGDNHYNSTSYVSGSPGSPVAACRPNMATCPVSASSCDPTKAPNESSCSNSAAEGHERQMDTMTEARADELKAQGVEIYVVGFGVCGPEDTVVPSAPYCASSSIGNANPDEVADQRLLKCIASSSSGTNDHYFRANTATELPGIFSKIAQTIAFRLVK